MSKKTVSHPRHGEQSLSAANPPAPKVSKREIRKRELRTRIVEAAMALFRERGFNETTIDDICDAADVARRTLYSYFSTKNEIIYSLCRSLIIEETINFIDLAVERHADLPSRLSFFFSRSTNNMNEADPLHKTLIKQMVADQSEYGDSNVMLLADLKDAFTGLFETANDLHGLNGTMNPRLSAEILISIISALSVNWINDESYPLTENMQQVEQYLLQNMR